MPQSSLEINKRYRENNRDKIAARMKEWRTVNRERSREIHREWAARNPESMRAHTRNWRARRRECEGTHTAKEVAELFAKQGHRCAACKERTKLTVDHVISLIAGGRNDIGNLQGLCLSCNSAKCDRHPVEFMQSRGYLL